MSDYKPPTPALKDASFTFLGLISLQGSLLPMKRTDGETRFTMICPACTEPTKVAQRYICPDHDDHGPYSTRDLDRAIEVDKGEYKRVTDEQIAEVKQPTLPKGEASFEVFPAKQVEVATIPTGSVYRIRPTAGITPYLMLVELLKDTSKAWVCELTLKGVQKMYRCISRDEMLVLTELVRPSELHPAESVEGEAPPEEVIAEAKRAVESQIVDFDPEVFANRTRERTAELLAELEDPSAPKKPKAAPPKVNDTDALLAALQTITQKAS